MSEQTPTQAPADLKYSQDHEWVRVLADDLVEIGITDYAQDALGDIVFVELPAADTAVTASESMGEVESTKSVSDIFAPVTGTVSEVNQALDETPELMNSDPYGQGWLCQVRLTAKAELEELLSAEQYLEFIGTQ